jgi:hypothetical protein
MTQSISLRIFSLCIAVSSLFVSVATNAYANEPTNSNFDTAVEIEGYAWSENIGWISMNCLNAGECGTSNYKVQINPDKTLSGYAWSSNVGWIKFGGLSGFPASGGNVSITGDHITGWSLQGWSRALANGDGWDGWISMNCTNTNTCGASDYSVDITVGGFSTAANSYAWGSEVIGWVQFSSSYFTLPCNQQTSCTSDYLGTIFTNQWCEQPSPVVSCNTAIGEVCTDATNACSVVTIDGTLTVAPSLARKNKTADISWTIANPALVSSCHVESNFGGSWNSNNSNSGPLTFNTNIFTLYCVPAGGGPDIEVDTKTVKLLPSVLEV